MDFDLTEGNEYKVILFFAMPVLFSNIIQQLYTFTDTLIVGRMLGENSLAAVGAGYNINAVILAVSMGLTIGISILISKMYGEKNFYDIQSAIDTGIIMTIIVSVVITILGFIGCRQLMNLFNVPKGIFDESVTYMRIIFLATVPSFLYNAVANYLRGIGDSKTPLYFIMLTAVLNVILDIVFIKYVHTGSAGAAVATVISQYISFILILIYVNKSRIKFCIRIKNSRFNKDILYEGLKIGIPAMLQQLLLGFGNAVIQILINGYGVAVVSAYTAASKIDGFGMMPAVNIGKSMSNYIAQNIGAKKHKRVLRGFSAGIVLITVISVILSSFIYLMAAPMVGIFCKDSEVINAGVVYLKTTSIFYILYGIMQILNGVLLGMNKSIICLLGSLLSFCLFQVPLAVILSNIIGVRGIWIAAPIGWTGGLLIRLYYYVKEIAVYK